MLTVLGLTTVAAPVLGLDGTDHSAHAHVPASAAAPAVQTQPSVLDLLDSRAATAQPSSPTPQSLLATPTAQARAESVPASRAAERGALDGVNVEGAHGTMAAAVPEKEIVMPLPQGAFRKTSSYGGRADPFTGGSSAHTGIDLAAPLDTPIHAVADGVVDYVGPGRAGRSSMIIVLKHEIDGQVVYSWYNHMYASGLYVEVGQQVQAGDVIAGVGNNGRSTGPHLHFEIHTDDDLTTTDPLAWLREQGAVDVSELP
ncbi:peptidase M23-like protein [Georgenia muralis]|uniref:Peptidase M23-like protein n=1 Tax=Georgenia muralis TaxID=154117 RepID=A0A3N4Z811_9MICO|nr:peptidase M23-like protein [Georgenia muralis]